MLNGKYDFFFPTETAQRPFFERLGTPPADKKWVVYEGGHDVPRPRLIGRNARVARQVPGTGEFPMTPDRLTAALADRYTIERELGAGRHGDGVSRRTISGTTARWRSRCHVPSSPPPSASSGSSPRSRPRPTCSIRTSCRCLTPARVAEVDPERARTSSFALLRHALRRGRDAARPPGPGDAAARRRRSAYRERDRRRAGLCPPAGRDPSRYQAGEHPAARGPAAGGGLRHCPAGREGRRSPAHRDRHVPRHAAVHEPGTGHGGARNRRAERHLRAGQRALRDAAGPAPVHRAQCPGDRGENHDR